MWQSFSERYILGYCSPKLAGEHNLSIAVLKDGATLGTSAGAPFNASGFDSPFATCSPTTFQTACNGKECGGLLCGSCGGVERCDGDGQCFNACIGKECGPDGYGGSCGTCSSGWSCVGGSCSEVTWLDPTSGLTWQVSPPTNSYSYTWGEAMSYCDSLSLGGHSDWHLPTIGELRTLIRGCPATEDGGSCNVEEGDCLVWSCLDDSCSGCSSKDGPGEGGMYWPDGVEGACCSYWSSAPVEDLDYYAWSVHFGIGSVYAGYVIYGVGGSNVTHVRCVR